MWYQSLPVVRHIAVGFVFLYHSIEKLISNIFLNFLPLVIGCSDIILLASLASVELLSDALFGRNKLSIFKLVDLLSGSLQSSSDSNSNILVPTDLSLSATVQLLWLSCHVLSATLDLESFPAFQFSVSLALEVITDFPAIASHICSGQP